MSLPTSAYQVAMTVAWYRNRTPAIRFQVG